MRTSSAGVQAKSRVPLAADPTLASEKRDKQRYTPLRRWVALLERARDRRERCRQARTDRRNGADDNDSDKRRYQAVFDGGCASLVVNKLPYLLHRKLPLPPASERISDIGANSSERAVNGI